MNVYKVVRRLVNVHQGVVVLHAAIAKSFGDDLKSLGKNQYQVVNPVQIPKDVVFGYDGALYPFNVKKVSQDKLVMALGEKIEVDSQPQSSTPTPDINLTNVNDIIMILDDLDEEQDFTESGIPEVKSIKALLKRNITAAERDEAWKRFQAEQSK